MFKKCWELEVMFSPKSNCEVEGGVVSRDWVLRVECFCSLLALTYDVFQAKQLRHPAPAARNFGPQLQPPHEPHAYFA